MLVLGGMSSAMALEYSVWDWWTNNQGLDGLGVNAPSWGNAYSGTTQAQLWNLLDPRAQVWHAATGTQGTFWLEAEWAGNASSNVFGYYEPTGAGATNLHPILDGINAPKYSESDPFVATAFGFYLSGPGGTFYSERERNSGYRQVRVFRQPSTTDTWILAWEDLAEPGNGGLAKYNAAWDPVTGPGSLDWASPTEPDYEDMIVRLTIHGSTTTNDGESTPELPTLALLACTALGSVGLLKRKKT